MMSNGKEGILLNAIITILCIVTDQWSKSPPAPEITAHTSYHLVEKVKYYMEYSKLLEALFLTL